MKYYFHIERESGKCTVIFVRQNKVRYILSYLYRNNASSYVLSGNDAT